MDRSDGWGKRERWGINVSDGWGGTYVITAADVGLEIGTIGVLELCPVAEGALVAGLEIAW